jgi:hypothetical protein
MLVTQPEKTGEQQFGFVDLAAERLNPFSPPEQTRRLSSYASRRTPPFSYAHADKLVIICRTDPAILDILRSSRHHVDRVTFLDYDNANGSTTAAGRLQQRATAQY